MFATEANATLCEVTTVTPQVFALFNSRFLREQTHAMAKRIEHEAGAERGAQVERAFQLTFQRSPSESERSKCIAFLNRDESQIAVKTDTAAKVTSSDGGESGPQPSTNKSLAALDRSTSPTGSLADLCLVLLNSNEFIFIQ